MKRMPILLILYLGIITVFMLAPIAVIIVSAFTPGDFVMFPPEGWSLRWFKTVLSSPDFMVALWNSLRLGAMATVLATILVVPATVALVRYRLPGSQALQAFMLSPLSLPTIILGIGLLFFNSRIGLGDTFAGLLFGHTVIVIPYIMRTVFAVYCNANHEIEYAASVHGASPVKAFWYVTVPLLRAGLLAGATFGFLMSFDEVSVALLLSSTDTTTLPVSILSYLVYNHDPAVAAISTIQIAIAAVLLLVMERWFGVRNLMFPSK